MFLTKPQSETRFTWKFLISFWLDLTSKPRVSHGQPLNTKQITIMDIIN